MAVNIHWRPDGVPSLGAKPARCSNHLGAGPAGCTNHYYTLLRPLSDSLPIGSVGSMAAHYGGIGVDVTNKFTMAIACKYTTIVSMRRMGIVRSLVALAMRRG